MKKNERNFVKREKGQILVLFVLMIVVLIGSAALATDIGVGYFQKTNLQNCADSAALAGAWNLPSTSNAINQAIYIAGQNGSKAVQNGVKKDGDTVTVTTPYNGDSSLIEVVCTRTANYSLAKVIGFNQSDITARAVAQNKSNSGAWAFGYAVFSGSPSATLAMTGNSTITGNVHSNYKVTMGGNVDITPTVDGAVEAVSSIDVGGHAFIHGTAQAPIINGSHIDNPIVGPVAVVPMYPDFSATIKSEADAAGSMTVGNLSITGGTRSAPIHIQGNLTISGNPTLTSTAPIYVNGNISISGNPTFATSTIFATGSITISGATASSSKMLIYSKNSSVTISGNSDIAGIIFAPNGAITVDGSSVQGRAIGNTVNFNGNYTVTSATDDLDVLPFSNTALQLVQ